MKFNTYVSWLLLLLRLTFGVILIYASYDKILNPLQFSQAIENYQVLGERLSRWLAIWLPYLELLTGLLLIFGIWLDSAILMNFLMMALFMGAVAQAYWRGLDISCGCFSSKGSHPIGMGKLFENILLLGGSISLLFAIPRKAKKA